MIVAAHQTMLAPQETWPVPLYTGVSLVGSSVRNNSGILSGFTTSSYATMPWRMTAGATSLEAVIKFSTPNIATTQGIWGSVGSINSYTPFYFEGNLSTYGFRSFLSQNGSSWTINATSGGWTTPPVANADIVLRSKWDGSSVSFDSFSVAWSTERALQLLAVYGASDVVPQLGTNRGSSWPFLGTIDLNYTYLMRDGELWWEGVAGAYKNVKTTYPD